MGLDIFEYMTETDGYNSGVIYSFFWKAQTFLAQVSHDIDYGFVWLTRVGSPGNCDIELYGTDANGLPTGAALDSDTIAEGDIPLVTLNPILFTLSYALAAGTKYAIVVSAPAGDAANYYIWAYQATEYYLLGNKCVSTDSGASWSAQAGDHVFEIQGDERVISVTTHDPINVGETSLTMKGEITSNHLDGVQRQFKWLNLDLPVDDPMYGVYTTVDVDVGTKGIFYYPLIGLSKGTRYDYRAQAHYSGMYCGQAIYGGTYRNTFTVPGMPKNVTADGVGYNSINLTWETGEGNATYITTLIRRKRGSFPNSWVDGVQVYQGALEEFQDDYCNPGCEYFYTLWTWMEIGFTSRLSEPVYIRAQTYAAPSSGTITFFCDDRDCYHHRNHATYLTAHDAATGTPHAYDASLLVGQKLGYYIYRGVLYFDTIGLPSRINITSAKVSCWCVDADAAAAWQLTLVEGDVTLSWPVVADYGALLDEITSFGTLASGDMTPGAWEEINLNAAGLAVISKIGTTTFGMRSNKDIAATAPAGTDTIEIATFEDSLAHTPKLEVTYVSTAEAPEIRAFIDWDGDGDFDESFEDVSDDIKRGSYRIGRDRELGKTICGTLDLLLDNEHRTYIPDNVLSEIYGMMTIGLECKIVAQFQGVSYPLFTGRIVDMNIHPRKLNLDMHLTIADGMAELNNVTLSLPFQEQSSASSLVNDILDIAGWRGPRHIVGDYDTMVYSIIFDSKSALDIIREVEEATNGLFYVARDGKATWEGGFHRTALVPVAPAATFDNNMVDLTYEFSDVQIFNSIDAVFQEHYWGDTLETIWTYTSTLKLHATGESITIRAEWDEIISPYWYGGAPYFSVIGVTGPTSGVLVFEIEISEFAAHSCLIKITFPDSAEYRAMYPEGLAFRILLRGFVMYTNKGMIHVEDVTSIAKYGRRTLKVGSTMVGTAQAAESYAQYALYWFKDPHPEITITIENVDATVTQQMLSLGISSRIRVINTELSLDQNYFIESLSHDFEGPMHQITYHLSEAAHQVFWLLNTSQLGTDTRLGF